MQSIENKIVTLSNGKIIEPEIILAATGRVPNITNRIDGVKYIGDTAGEIQLSTLCNKKSFRIRNNIPFKRI